MNEINLLDLYGTMQNEMLQKLKSGCIAFSHSTTKGTATELNWIEWFRTYLPKRYKVDQAMIIDSEGRQSDQIDLVIYDAQYSYMVFKRGDSILIPAESVYAVFEVKQNLNKQYIKDAGRKAKSVRQLTRTSVPIPHAGGQYPPKELLEIVSGILTTSCDWKNPIKQNVITCLNNQPKDERLDFVCSIQNNTFVVKNNLFVNQYEETPNPTIKYCEKDQSLVYLHLNLLKRLQDMGTVPAMDFEKYADKITAEECSKE